MTKAATLFFCLILMQAALKTVHGFTSHSAVLVSGEASTSSQLSMAWSLPSPSPPSFQPVWYQDCGNPCIRRVTYDDNMDGDDEPYAFSFSTSNYGLEESRDDIMYELPTLRRGTRLGRVARRAIQSLRNALVN